MTWSGNVTAEVEEIFREASRARYGVLPKTGEDIRVELTKREDTKPANPRRWIVGERRGR